MNDQDLIDAYREMYEHTNPECGKCAIPHSCCDPVACDSAMYRAQAEWGVELKPTGFHPKLPLMGPEGCIAEPHFRPLCTVHQCEIGSRGYHKDDEWTKRYFEIRERLDTLEYERAQGRVARLPWRLGPHGTRTRKLSGGYIVTLGTSDSAFPPGEGGGKMKLNTSAVWLKVEVEDHEALGYPFPLGWWARLHSVTSMQKARGMIDHNGYTLPAEMAADYWCARVFELEANLARAKAFCEEHLEGKFQETLTETFTLILARDKDIGWSGEPK